MNTVTENRIEATRVDTIDVLRRFHFGEPAATADTTPPPGCAAP